MVARESLLAFPAFLPGDKVPLLTCKVMSLVMSIPRAIFQASLWRNLMTWSKASIVPFIHLQCILWFGYWHCNFIYSTGIGTGAGSIFTLQLELDPFLHPYPRHWSESCPAWWARAEHPLKLPSVPREQMWTVPTARWPLHCACMVSDADCVELLLEKGAEVMFFSHCHISDSLKLGLHTLKMFCLSLLSRSTFLLPPSR